MKKLVLSHAREIYRYVKVEELIPELVNPELSFVTRKELEKLHKISGDSKKARELLVILNKKGSLATCKFVACLSLEHEHSGHQELAQELMRNLSQNERERIKNIISKATCNTEKACQVEKPLPHIELQGYLKGSKFDKLNHHLWFYLQEGQYESFYTLTTRMRCQAPIVVEYQIIGLWFESVAYIHNDKDHENCISNLLKPALELCKDPQVTNQTILEGRLYQRLSQLSLIIGKNHEAIDYFHMAESRLQFISRGYDRVQLLLRNAKILSATSSCDKEKTEMLYAAALDCISDDDPFAFSCCPSLYLSKAAHHLEIAFGSKPSPTVEPLTTISPENIRKANDALSALSRKNFKPISIRQCEQDLVKAELLRHEGNIHGALEAFEDVKQMSAQKGLDNLVSIAEHRIKFLVQEKFKADVIDKLLEDSP
ncbi:MAG: hypothetical protein MJE68_01815 [Proteobacteria bacterium]|nr:hypothetical protein [Pseudomonadota bacterium]